MSLCQIPRLVDKTLLNLDSESVKAKQTGQARDNSKAAAPFAEHVPGRQIPI